MQWPNTSLNDSIQSVTTATHVSVPSLSSSVISSFEELTTPSADSKMETSSVVSAQDHDKVEILDESLDSTTIGTEVPDQITPKAGATLSDDSDSTCAGTTSLDNGMAEDTSSIRSVSTTGSFKRRLQLSSHLFRSTLIYRGASPRPRGMKLPVRCVQSQDYLGNSVMEIRQHLDRHPPKDADIICHICQIAFKNADSVHHLASTAHGHCGFDFDHIEPCNGHHPPDVFSEMLTDNDRLRVASKLQHWEYIQFRTYLDQVNDLVSGDVIPADIDCWSIDALRSSLGSIPSMLGLRKPSSVPDSSDYLGRQTNSLSRGRYYKAAAVLARRQLAQAGVKSVAVVFIRLLSPGRNSKIAAVAKKQIAQEGAKLVAVGVHRRRNRGEQNHVYWP